MTGVRTGMLVPMVAVFWAATAFGASELKWYASRSAVVCTEVPQQPPIRLMPSSLMKRSIQEAISAAPSG